MLRDKKGLTLVEVLIAMVVLLLVSLALMQTALMSIDSNVKNLLRDEAVSIAETEMNEARNIEFDALASAAAATITRQIRGLKDPADATRDFPYTVTRTVNNLTTDNSQIDITVAWSWKGEPYSHGTTTIVRRPGD